MRRRSLDLVLVYAVTVLGALLVVADVPGSVLRWLFTLPIVLLFPGYALLEALHPQGGLGIVEQLLVALGLSLALVALGGLALHLLPWGLQAGTFLLYLCAIIFGATFVAWLRRSPAQWARIGSSLSMNRLQGMYLGLSVLLAAGAIALAISGARSARGAVPTQFWFLPADAAGTPYLQVTVRNMEPQTITYRIGLEIDGRSVYRGEPITLKPQEMVSPRFSLPESQGRSERIEIKLYRLGSQETVYRRLTYWRAR